MSKTYKEDYTDIEIIKKKKIRIIKDINIQEGTLRVNPKDFDEIIELFKDSLSKYLNFYKGVD